MRHYVYVHRRASDGRIFYVGKGSNPDRAYCTKRRNPYWHAVVAKHGLIVEIVLRFETDELAQQCERDLIAWYGRRQLTNLTDGGDGCSGISPSQETRSKLSALASRPRTEAWVRSMKAARTNGGNGGVVKHGDKLPPEWRANIAKAKVGPGNPFYGKRTPIARKVRGEGVEYESVSDAANALGMKMKTLYNMLSGHRPNRTNLRFA